MLDINVTSTQVCLSIEAHTIRLPPPQVPHIFISQYMPLYKKERKIKLPIRHSKPGESVSRKWTFKSLSSGF